MTKPYYTRKNLILIALAFFYSLLVVFTGACIDGAHSIFSRKNMINLIAQTLGFDSIAAGTAGFVSLILIGIYIVVLVALIIFERRYAIVNNKKTYSFKMIMFYILTFVGCVLLSLGVGLLIQTNLGKDIGTLMTFLSQSLILGSLLFLVIFGLVAFGAMLVVNFIFVDKPFKFWNKNEQIEVGEPDDVDVDITNSFDINPTGAPTTGAPGVGGVGGTSGGGDGEQTIRRVEELDDREKVFPALSSMDNEYGGYSQESFDTTDISLNELCERFRNYLAKEEKLYFDIDTIRVFISGFASSHFMILEGLSGTGKSSLPRYFAKFINANLLFVPVQTTWRDKSSLFGYFNDFSKTYTETDFLLNLYHANYNPEQIHIFVLDEMNISRVEYTLLTYYQY